MPLQGTQSAIHSTRNSSPYNTDYESDERESLSSHSAPRLRATSEPPPDLDDHTRPLPESEFIYEHRDTSSSSKAKTKFGMKLPPLSASSSDVQQYSWEWGAFPTPSPMKTTFAKGGRLDAMPWKSKTKHLDELSQREVAGEDTVLSDRGKLSAKEGDDSVFVVTIQQQSFDFQLSLVPQLLSGTKEKGKPFVLPNLDDNACFAKGSVTFSRFMQDEHLADNANLVIKWSDGKYMTRQDHPVLFSALVLWRTNCLFSRIRHMEENISLNGSSHNRSISEPPTPEQRARAEARFAKIEGESGQGHHTSSWVQWWNGSRQKDAKFSRGVSVRERPALKPAVSAPSTIDVVSCHSLGFG